MQIIINKFRTWLKEHKLIAGSIFILGIVALGLLTFPRYKHVFIQEAQKLSQRPMTIKGEIVTLEYLNEKHFIDYHNMFSKIVRRNLEYPEEITLDYTIRQLRHEMKQNEKGQILNYCIFDNKDQKLIGSIEIRHKTDKDPGQMGCWINEAYWGGGRFQEALKLISKAWFETTGEPSYNAHVRTWNKRSYHALKKFGMKDVGYFYEDGEPTRHILEYYAN